MEQAQKILFEKLALLEGIGQNVPVIMQASEKTGQKPGLVLGAGLFLTALFMLMFSGISPVVSFCSVTYAGIMSIKAIDSDGKGDDAQWLSFWMVFGALDVAETFLPFVFWLIPYWSLIRAGFFLWLIRFNGAQIMNEQYLKPVLNEHRATIEEYLKKFQDRASSYAEAAKTAATDPNNMMKAAAFAQQAKAQVEQVVTNAPQDHVVVEEAAQ